MFDTISETLADSSLVCTYEVLTDASWDHPSFGFLVALIDSLCIHSRRLPSVALSRGSADPTSAVFSRLSAIAQTRERNWEKEILLRRPVAIQENVVHTSSQYLSAVLFLENELPYDEIVVAVDQTGPTCDQRP